MTNTEVIPPQPVSLWRNRDYLLLWLGQRRLLARHAVARSSRFHCSLWD